MAACDDGEERLMWNKKLEKLFNIPVLFHKYSTVSLSSSLLPGSIVEPYCIIGDGSTLKSGTIVKSISIVGVNATIQQETVLYVPYTEE